MLFLLLLLLIPNIIHSAVSLLTLKFFARLAVVIHQSNSPTLLCFCVANTHYLNHVSTLIFLFGRCKNYPVKISPVCRDFSRLLTKTSKDHWVARILSDRNRIRTHNHLVRKRTPNNLAKLANYRV